jgi:hypothetical protein
MNVACTFQNSLLKDKVNNLACDGVFIGRLIRRGNAPAGFFVSALKNQGIKFSLQFTHD